MTVSIYSSTEHHASEDMSLQLYCCGNLWSCRCPQFSNTTVRTSDLADAPHSAMPLWERQVSHMLPVQQYLCESLWSRRCSPFGSSTMITSVLADAPNSAIPLWKGEISQIPPPVYTWIACWPVSNHCSNSMVTSSQMFLVNFCPLLNSVLKPEQIWPFTQLICCLLETFSVLRWIYFISRKDDMVLCCVAPTLCLQMCVHMWIIICVVVSCSSSVSCGKTLSVGCSHWSNFCKLR